MTEYRQGFIHGSSRSADSANSLLSGEYDVALLSSSWDKRCLSIADCRSLSLGSAIVVLFDAVDDLGLREEHDPKIVKFAETVSGSQKMVRGDSHDICAIWNQVMAHVISVYKELCRPLKILVDLSSCPRYLSVGLVCDSIQSGLASEVSVFYAEGDYPEETSEQQKHELFTSGGWDAIPIPSLDGEWSPDMDRAYLVSVGFEGSKTLRLVSRAEPDQVFVLFPDPGVKDTYVQRTWDRNATLLARLRDSETDLVRANAGDAIEAWKHLDEASLEQHREQNIYYACCGTKPHSLALGLRAAVLKYPAVLYIVPDRHKVVDVNPLGVFWEFSLRDMTSLRSGIDGE